MTDPSEREHVFKITAGCTSILLKFSVARANNVQTNAVTPMLEKKQEYPGAVLTIMLSGYESVEKRGSSRSAVYRSLSRLAGCGRDAASRSAVERAASVERKEARARLPKQGCSDASLLRCAAPD